MKTTRLIESHIEESLFRGKVVIIYGPRQAGKTTLTKQLIEKYKAKIPSLYLNCEMLSIRQQLSKEEPYLIKNNLGNAKFVVLDEAQKISNIGTILKLMVDTFPEIQIIATGSSSFEIGRKTFEPLTGRVDRFTLYPLAIEELLQKENRFEITSKLEKIIRFGLYPEIYHLSEQRAISRLNEIATDYLYKDVLAFEGLKKSSLIVNLLQLLALQIGSQVSYNELANNLGVSRLLVQKYIDILEQSFVIFTLRAFSRNLRKEIAKSVKIYFYDVGIRNSLIQNFNSLELRDDIGGLWENLCILERLKYNQHHRIFANYYFWRTYDQQEIDFIEERGGRLHGYEFTYGSKKKRPPKIWLKTYTNSSFECINEDTFLDFVS